MAYIKPTVPKKRGHASVGIEIKGNVRGDIKTFKSAHSADIYNSYQLDVQIPPSLDLMPLVDFVGSGESADRASTFGGEGNPSSSVRFVGIENSGTCTIELGLECRQWKDTVASGDEVLSAGSDYITTPMVSMLLHRGESIVLPTNRMLVYNAANGSAVANQASAAGGKTVREIIGPTDGNGYFASEVGGGAPDIGIVPGSVLMNFYGNAYAPLGLTSFTYDDTSTGLALNTEYAFRLDTNFGTSADVAFTTDANNVTWGGSGGVLSKINAALEALVTPYDGFRLVIAKDTR